jgi:hypothetical protein
MTRANLRPGAWNYLILATILFCGAQIRAQCDTVYADLSIYPPDYDVLQNSELFSLVESGVIPGLTTEYVDQLYKGKNPTIYILDNSTYLKLYSQTAKKVITDAPSVHLLENADPMFSNVEMIEIKIKSANDLSQVVQNINWAHFQQLRFVHIQFEFQVCPFGQNIVQCEKQEVADLFQQIFPNNIYLTYSISLTE